MDIARSLQIGYSMIAKGIFERLQGIRMPNKTELIKQFSHAREDFRTLLPDIDPNMEIYPGWKIKEVLAHLAGWDDATILALEAFVAQQPPPVPALKGIDPYNSQTVAERADLGYKQIVQEWELIREQLLKILEGLSDTGLAAAIVSPWGQSLTVEALIRVMIEHEEEHAEIIRGRLANPHIPLRSH